MRAAFMTRLMREMDLHAQERRRRHKSSRRKKGFPGLKNTAAVFVFGTHFTSGMEICSWGIHSWVYVGREGGGRAWGRAVEECKKVQKACAIINATQHVGPFVSETFEKPPRLWFRARNWLSPFEKQEPATCLTWFRGLASLKRARGLELFRLEMQQKSLSFPIIASFCGFAIKRFVYVGSFGKFLHKRRRSQAKQTRCQWIIAGLLPNRVQQCGPPTPSPSLFFFFLAKLGICNWFP